MVSIVVEPGAAYPGPESSYSPSERYPEYAYDEVAPRPNRAYALVREALRQAGLDAKRFGEASWNPLGAFLSEGQRAFLLCNFVYHRRPQEAKDDIWAKCTHGAVLRAVADYALKAVGPSGRVLFGNAPLQSCDWDKVLAETGSARVVEFYRRRGLPVEARDLRLRVAHRDLLGRVRSMEMRDDARSAAIDLAGDSLLATIGTSAAAPRFRVSDYDPHRIESFHRGGSHRYVIHRDILRADAVISLPKLKTHEKVGITCALKGFVGTVAHKDCLAHHRFGNPSRGGDEYPDSLSFLRPLSAYHDWVNARPAGAALQGVFEIVDRTSRRIARRLGAHMAGAWHGNDTAWRMALDLARIVHHADREGILRDHPQRTHAALIDGIVAGEGDGPLDPRPYAAGALIFAENVVDADLAASRLMGFDPARIPLLHEAGRTMRWALPSSGLATGVVANGRAVRQDELGGLLPRGFEPPSGWRSVLGASG